MRINKGNTQYNHFDQLNNRQKGLTIGLLPDQILQLKEKAQQNGMTVTAYVIDKCLGNEV